MNPLCIIVSKFSKAEFRDCARGDQRWGDIELATGVDDQIAPPLIRPLKQQPSNAEHVVLDVEHAHLLMRAARLHAGTQQDFGLILHGAAESLRVERMFKGVLGDAMADLPDPA